jgi:hypothetical protein
MNGHKFDSFSIALLSFKLEDLSKGSYFGSRDVSYFRGGKQSMSKDG